MVIDSNSTRRSKDDRGGNNSRKKSGIRKGESSSVSASANTGSSSLSRLTRGTAAREQITSTSSSMETPAGKASSLIHSNMRKSERLEKNDTTPPVKRKLEVLGREKTSSSPLRRSDRGKKHLSLVSSDSNNNGKETASPDDNMQKLRGQKSVKHLTLEAMETTEAAEEVKISNCRIKKRMNGHTYKFLFAPQRIKEIGPVLDEELGRAEKLSKDDRTCFGVSVSNPVEDGKDGVRECIENVEECIERDCEGGKEQSISKLNNSNAIEFSNHGELETSCLNSKYCSREALGEPSQENGVNSFNGSTIGEEIIDDSERLQVDYASVVELRTPEMERLADDNVEEGTDVVSLPLSECEKDNFVGTCASCCRRQRLNKNSPAQELCICNSAPINDFLKTSRSEGGVELAQCDDSHNDALNDGNLSTCAICKHDGELLPDSSRFIEYWVPVSTSNVQLEQYCATLLSNYTTLRASSWSKDIVGALHDILISVKKCCDHPYFVDSGLQAFLTKDLRPVDYLDVGIKASGKLQLLDAVLSKIKSRGKRVIILYQSTRYAGMLTGDILDDFLRQRFGLDSYERVDGGIVPSKKQAALNKFNDMNSGRFVFLLEKRACTSAIKLSSVDAIVIFDSDWNIKNDYRALTKLSIDSSLEPIKMFRLYTSCTLEEKVLDLATNRVSLDSNLLSINRITCHMLLMWGASYLFSKLDEFHSGSASSRGTSLCSGISMQNDVAGELMDIIIQNAENSYKNSLITKVQHTGGIYGKTAPLFGQLKFKSTDEKVPHLFWKELLECKNPRWKFLPVHSPRNRKRAQYLVDLPKPDGEPDDVTKKQKKKMKNSADAASLRTRHGEGGSLIASPKSTVFIPCSPKNIPASEVPMAGSKEEIKLCDLQKNLHSLLKPAVLKLSESLQIPDDMKIMGEILLEYIVNNHQISSEPESILQAFQISLIWMAASLLRYNLDRKQSLDVAKQHLGFRCTEEEVINVYSKLRPLKKTFQKRSQKFKELESKNDFSEDRLKQIQKKCEKRKMKLLRKHEEEIQEFNSIWEKERVQIENDHKAESAVIRTIYFSASAVRLDKLKRVDNVFTKKINEHKREKEFRLQELRGKHLNERTKEDQKADSWLKYVQESVVSVSGEKQCLNRTETSEVAPSTNPITAASETVGCSIAIEIPTVPSQSLRGTGIMEKQLGDLCCSDDAFGNNSVGGNHPSIAEQIPDGSMSAVQETENSPNEFAGGAMSPDPSKPDGESSKHNNLRNDTDISDLDPMGSCSAAGSSKHDAIYTEPPSVTSPLVQILEAPGQDVTSLPNLAPQDESSRLSISAGILDGNATGCENTDSLEQSEDNNRPSTAEQIPDFTTSVAQETDENAPKELPGGAKSSDTSKPVGESDEDNNLRNDINISDSDPKENGGGCSRNDGTFTVLPLVTSLSVQILEAQAQDVASRQNLAPQDECSTSSTSAGIRDEDATSCKNTNNLEQAEAECPISAEVTDHSNDAQGCENSKILEQAVIQDGDAPGCENTNALEQAEVEHPTSVEVTAHSNDGQACEDSNILEQAVIHDGDAIGSENTNALEQAEFEHQTTAEATAHTNDGQGCENSNILEQAVVQPLHPTSSEVSNRDSCAASSVMDDAYTRTNDSYNVTDLIERGPPLALHNPELTENCLPHVEWPPSENGEQSIMERGDNLLPPLHTQVVDEVLNHDGTQMGVPPPTDTPIVGLGPHLPSRRAQQMNLRAQPQPSHSDPLQIELERLHKETEEATKLHEDAKLQLKSEYDKELEEAIAEIRRKYEAKLKTAKAEYSLKKKELDANHNKVFMNRILAETFRTKCLEFRHSTSSGMDQGQSTNFLQQLLSLSLQTRRTSVVSGSTSAVPPAASQQSSVPSVPALQRSSSIITSTQMRQPRTLPNNHPIGNSPVSGEMRAPAPHLRPLLSTSAPSCLSASQGLPGQDPQRQPHFSTVAQVRPRLPLPVPPRQSLMQPPCQPIPHDQVPQPEYMGICNPSVPAVGSVNVENLPGGRVPNALPRAPGLGSNFGTYLSHGGVQGGDRVGGGVNRAHSSVLTDVVCLSDDE